MRLNLVSMALTYQNLHNWCQNWHNFVSKQIIIILQFKLLILFSNHGDKRSITPLVFHPACYVIIATMTALSLHYFRRSSQDIRYLAVPVEELVGRATPVLALLEQVKRCSDSCEGKQKDCRNLIFKQNHLLLSPFIHISILKAIYPMRTNILLSNPPIYTQL